MSYPGDQMTAPASEGRRYPPGQHAFVPSQGPFGDERAAGIPPAEYAGPSYPAQDTDRRAGSGSGPGSGNRHGRHARHASSERARPAEPAATQRSSDAGPNAPGRDGPGRRSRGARGPAHGYPPKPGEPDPWYPQQEFSAWNEAEPPTPADPGLMMASAPTWSDVGPGNMDSWSAGGVALAERPADEAEPLDDDLVAWHAVISGQSLARSGDRQRALAERPAPGPVGLTSSRDLQDAAPASDIQPRRTRSAPRTDSPPALAGGAPALDSGIQAAPVRRSRAAAARARKTARQRGQLRRRVLAGTGGVLVLALGVAGYLFVSSSPSKSAAASRETSTTLSMSNPAPSLGPWQHIATRAGDSAPLTLSQLFPAQFTVGSASYVRTVQLGETNCAHAVFGSKLQAAVHKYGCSQVMRASYLSAGQRLMGTIGVLNLTSSAGAGLVGKAAGSSQFIAQLTAATGPTHNLTKGTGLEEAEVKGHYLILIWAEFTTLRAPKTAAQKTQLKSFSANLISRTANISLTSRMVTGKPQTP
ncbi:MAG TPA: hypothetical protein VGL63_11175 [Streptosporangiaceae bacterium]